MHGIETDESHYIEPQADAKKKDLAFCLCRYLDNRNILPNWTGYNAKVVSEHNTPIHTPISPNN